MNLLFSLWKSSSIPPILLKITYCEWTRLQQMIDDLSFSNQFQIPYHFSLFCFRRRRRLRNLAAFYFFFKASIFFTQSGILGLLRHFLTWDIATQWIQISFPSSIYPKKWSSLYTKTFPGGSAFKRLIFLWNQVVESDIF